MDRVSSTMKQVSNPLPKVLSRRGGGGGLEAERESFERTQVRVGWGMRTARKGRCQLRGLGQAGRGPMGTAREVPGAGTAGRGCAERAGLSQVGDGSVSGRGQPR